MRMYDIIDKKKKGLEISDSEIKYMIDGYVKEDIPDYQMSAFLMSVYYMGMNDSELLTLTNAMAASGDIVDLSAINGIKVDKHSTGGVGDKTTLVVGPIVAACGGKVAKMSGRGLGFTGGTVDKLEAIPGYKTDIPKEEFYKNVNSIGVSIIGQSAEIALADKKLYALRDVTATVDSIPLIASSIMSKKLASGSDKIVLDVTVGSGAFMKSEEDAISLAQKMVAIGKGVGKETVAYLTNMDIPLGIAVGNNLEVIEAIDTLKGNGTEDFYELCIQFAATMLSLGGMGSTEKCKILAKNSIEDGSALNKFADMVEAQGGNKEFIYDTQKFDKAKYSFKWVADRNCYIEHMDTERCGKTSVILGAGREVKESILDYTAGIKFYKKTGSYLKQGDIIAELFASDKSKIDIAFPYLKKAYKFGNVPVNKQKTIIAFISKDGVEKL